MEERKRVEAAKEHMHKLSAAREEQLYALKASLLAERCASPSSTRQSVQLLIMVACSTLWLLYMPESLDAQPRGARCGRTEEQ